MQPLALLPGATMTAHLFVQAPVLAIAVVVHWHECTVNSMQSLLNGVSCGFYSPLLLDTKMAACLSVQAPVPVIALVGYTNAGKSTLLNKVTEASVLAEDKLFATLDPTTRRAPATRRCTVSSLIHKLRYCGWACACWLQACLPAAN